MKWRFKWESRPHLSKCNIKQEKAHLVSAGLQHKHVIEAQIHVGPTQEVAANFQRLHLAALIKAEVIFDQRLAAACITLHQSEA